MDQQREILYTATYVHEIVNKNLSVILRLTDEKIINEQLKPLLKGYMCELAFLINNDIK
jgi:hypothetical protein